jgi:hypothetical protein
VCDRLVVDAANARLLAATTIQERWQQRQLRLCYARRRQAAAARARVPTGPASFVLITERGARKFVVAVFTDVRGAGLPEGLRSES